MNQRKKKEPLKDDSLDPSSGQLHKFLRISTQLFTLSLSIRLYPITTFLKWSILSFLSHFEKRKVWKWFDENCLKMEYWTRIQLYSYYPQIKRCTRMWLAPSVFAVITRFIKLVASQLSIFQQNVKDRQNEMINWSHEFNFKSESISFLEKIKEPYLPCVTINFDFSGCWSNQFQVPLDKETPAEVRQRTATN
jgi:hypothetical protein